MRFNRIFPVLLVSLIISTSITGCGLLGTKIPPLGGKEDLGNGCLNNAKDLFQRYTKGQVTTDEWKSSFDCIGQSLDFFTKYVRGTKDDAYTQSDMYTFVSRFIITNRTVQKDLMRGAFQLKASLFGGNTIEFKKEEIETFKSMLPRIADITAELIPYLAIQQKSADYESYLELADAFKRAGDQLSDLVNSLPVGVLSQQSVTLLVDQLATSMDIELVEGLSTKVFVGKWLLFNSRLDAIEEKDWGQIVKTAMNFGGLAIAVMKAPPSDLFNDYRYREFMWEIAQKMRPLLNEALAHHNGIIPLPLLDHLVDEIPESIISVPHQIMKQSLRPIIRKFLASHSKIGIDAGVLNTIYGLGGTWIKNLGFLDRLYESGNLNTLEITPVDFSRAMTQFALSLSVEDQIQFAKIQSTLLSYKPQFYKGTTQIRFETGVNYSKFQHLFVLIAQQVAEHLRQTYGSGPDYFLEGDFQAFYKDFIDLLFALNVVDPTVANWAGNRFTQMDLFTLASNGDAKASYQEIVYYAMLLISAGDLQKQMKTEIIERCDQNLGEDILGHKWVSAPCFRNEFHGRFEYWLNNFPYVKAYWGTLNQSEREKALIWLEHGARRNGFTEDHFASYDFSAMPTVLHYAESLFVRFVQCTSVDRNGTCTDSMTGSKLNKTAILKAFPVFQGLLSVKAKMPASKVKPLQGIFTYIVYNREMPDTAGVSGILKLVGWLATWNARWNVSKISTDRAGVFNIICLLAFPESKTQQDLTPTICKP